MLRIFKKSMQTGIVTSTYPKKKDIPPQGFRGMPTWDGEKCHLCGTCSDKCPTKAINIIKSNDANTIAGQQGSSWAVDARKCIFCGYCEDACANDAISMGAEFELSEIASNEGNNKIYSRSVHIRHLDAGSCNACDWEMAALTGPVYDIQRFGFDFVASPRHADILMVTGPVTRNLEIAASKTYNAAPAPKLVVAVGTCACSGGICGKSYASAGGGDNILPVDVYIPGCPPRPQALIHGLLNAVNRL